MKKLEKRVHRYLNNIFPSIYDGLWENPIDISTHLVQYDDFEDNNPSTLIPFIRTWQKENKRRYLN